jgi:hypothetical protein
MSSQDYPLFLENGVQLNFLPSWALNDLKLVSTNLISNSHILTKRDINNQPIKYPVIIFSHGLKGYIY